MLQYTFLYCLLWISHFYSGLQWFIDEMSSTKLITEYFGIWSINLSRVFLWVRLLKCEYCFFTPLWQSTEYICVVDQMLRAYSLTFWSTLFTNWLIVKENNWKLLAYLDFLTHFKIHKIQSDHGYSTNAVKIVYSYIYWFWNSVLVSQF